MSQYEVIKGKLYPNAKQATFFNKCFGCARFVYNKILDSREDAYNLKDDSLIMTPAKLKKEYTWLKEVDSLALCNSEIAVNNAFKKFFKGTSNYPKHHSKKKSRLSYTTNNQTHTIRVVKNSITGTQAKEEYDATSKDRIKLPKVKWVSARLNKSVPNGYKINSATISKDSVGDYFISILCESTHDVGTVNTCNISEDGSNVVGIDFKMSTGFITSDGEDCEYPKYYRQSEIKLAREQRKLSKMEYNSKNYLKQKAKIAKLHRKIARQREDFLHKKSTSIAKKYDFAVLEDINLQTMSKTLKFGKSVHDVGFGMFRVLLSYKLERKGGKLVKVPKDFPSTQLCSNCGYKNTDLKGVDALKVREWECPECHAHHDRDINSGVNLKNYLLNNPSLILE